MPNYEVEICFKVEASDKDDAVMRVRQVLDKVTITLESGLKGYFTYDNCAHEVKEK
jgi:hypothetical protein